MWDHCFELLGVDVCVLSLKARMDPLLVALSAAYNGYLRFTSGATPADLLAASQAIDLALNLGLSVPSNSV